MDEKNRPEPKIGIPLMIAGFIWYGLSDVISEIPFAGDAVDVLDGITDIFVIHFGIGGPVVMTVDIFVEILKAIPIVQELPGLQTLSWIITIIYDRFSYLLPEKLRKAGEAWGKVQQAVESGDASKASEALEGAAAGAGGAVEAGAAAAAEAGGVSEGAFAESAGAAGTRTESIEANAAERNAARGEGGAANEDGASGEEAGAPQRGMAGEVVPARGSDEEGEKSDEEKEKAEQNLSPEQRELNDILEGNYAGRIINQTMTPEEILSEVGNQDIGKKQSGQPAKILRPDFNQRVRSSSASERAAASRPTPRPAPQAEAGDDRYNSNEVDLRDREAA